jgi:hypothetical protein
MQVDDIAVPDQSAQLKDCTKIAKLRLATIVEKSHMTSPRLGGSDGEGCIPFGRTRHNRAMARRHCRLDLLLRARSDTAVHRLGHDEHIEG